MELQELIKEVQYCLTEAILAQQKQKPVYARLKMSQLYYPLDEFFGGPPNHSAVMEMIEQTLKEEEAEDARAEQPAQGPPEPARRALEQQDYKVSRTKNIEAQNRAKVRIIKAQGRAVAGIAEIKEDEND